MLTSWLQLFCLTTVIVTELTLTLPPLSFCCGQWTYKDLNSFFRLVSVNSFKFDNEYSFRALDFKISSNGQ